jgi:ubiquinone/menaquinone biosynthesis C-methylase UbiE
MKMGRLEKFFVNRPGHSRRVSQHATKLLQFTNAHEGQNYLDVGCGNGAAAIHIAQQQKLKVTGVDVDPEQIQAAQKAAEGVANARFLAVDATRLPFADGKFDVVATNKTTHHIPDWKAAVTEMARVVKPNGYLIYRDFVLPRPLASLGGKTLKKMGFPTSRTLDSLAEKHGLAPLHLSKLLIHYEAVWQKRF